MSGLVGSMNGLVQCTSSGDEHLPSMLRHYELSVDHAQFLKHQIKDGSFQAFTAFLNCSVLWLSDRVFLVDRKMDRWLRYETDFRNISTSHPLLTMHTHTDCEGSVNVWSKQSFQEGDVDGARPCIDLLLRLVEGWSCPSIVISSDRTDKILDVSDEQFATLVSGSHMKELVLLHVHLRASQCHALGHSQTDRLKLSLWDVTMEDSSAFYAGMPYSLGPTILEVCNMNSTAGLDMFGLLQENTKLERIALEGTLQLETEHGAAISRILGVNKGLKELKLSCSVSDDVWDILWKAIARHPCLELVDVRYTMGDEPSCINQRTQKILACLGVNKVIQGIWVSPRERNEDTWRLQVMPTLRKNKYQPRFESISGEGDHSLRGALVAKALSAVYGETDLLHLALLCNLEALLN